MKKGRKVISLLLCASLILSGMSFSFAATDSGSAAQEKAYMQEIVKALGEDLDGEQMMDYLSYVYLGWRTTGGPWQNQVIDNFARGELVDAGYTDAGAGSSASDAKSENDKSSVHDKDYVWTTYFDDISSLTWSPEYAKLEVSTEADFEGVEELIKAVNVESYSFDPTSDTYQEYYSDLYDIPEAEDDDSWIDGMWDWITSKDADGNRLYVNKEDPQAGEESKLQKRVHLAWNSCFTDDRGTDPAEAEGVTGEVVYIGTVNRTGQRPNYDYECPMYPDLTELEGKVLLSDSSLSYTFEIAKKAGAIAVASKASLNNYSTPKDADGNIIAPFDDSARYASGAALATTKAQTESGAPIVEWQFSNNQYDALKELVEKADQPVIAKNIAIGTAYAMNDEAYGGKGQAITVAEIKGATKPDERVFLCAHVQEPGSNDNATGVATLLGMATAYKKMLDEGKIDRPERTITFMWGDEMSMADLYMSSHAEEKEGLITVLDLDMTGEDPEKTGGVMRIEKTPDPSAVYNYTLDTLPWEDPNYLDEAFADPYGDFTRLPDSHTLWGAGSISGLFQEGFYLNDLYMYATQNVIEHHDDEFQVDVCPYEGGSDHSRFLMQGIPAMLTWHFTDYTYHTSVDTLAMSSGREMENVGITSLAAAILNADVIDDNEAYALEMLEMVRQAALDRMENEKQNTINHKIYTDAKGADPVAEVEQEIEVLNAWAAWYQEAILSVEGLLDKPSEAYIAARDAAAQELEDARKGAVTFALIEFEASDEAVALGQLDKELKEAQAKAAEEIAALEKAIAEGDEKAAAEKAAAEKALQDAAKKAADDVAAVEKALGDKAAVEKAALDQQIAELKAQIEALSKAPEPAPPAPEMKQLAAPTKVKASNIAKTGKVKVSWAAVEGADEYKIYRATKKDGKYTYMNTVAGTTYTNKTAKAGKVYYYKVKALTDDKAVQNSEFSAVVKRTCDYAQPVVTAKAGKKQVKLTWKKVENAKKYQIYRATSKNGTYKKVATVTKLTYTNKNLKAKKTYYYKVKAIGVNGAASVFSAVDKCKTKG